MTKRAKKVSIQVQNPAEVEQKKKLLEELRKAEEELAWLENTPFYIGRDGMPSFVLIIFILATGVLGGVLAVLIYRSYKKKSLRKRIEELKKDGQEKV